jgi:hypothetical protein
MPSEVQSLDNSLSEKDQTSKETVHLGISPLSQLYRFFSANETEKLFSILADFLFHFDDLTTIKIY